jgi:hypothetical protein
VSTPTAEPEYITKAEAARLLRIGPWAVNGLIARGLLVEARNIPGVRARWRRADVLALGERYTAPIPASA